jgi:hypothetical protein
MLKPWAFLLSAALAAGLSSGCGQTAVRHATVDCLGDARLATGKFNPGAAQCEEGVQVLSQQLHDLEEEEGPEPTTEEILESIDAAIDECNEKGEHPGTIEDRERRSRCRTGVYFYGDALCELEAREDLCEALALRQLARERRRRDESEE